MTLACTYVDGVLPGLQRFSHSQNVNVGPVLPILVLLWGSETHHKSQRKDMNDVTLSPSVLVRTSCIT